MAGEKFAGIDQSACSIRADIPRMRKEKERKRKEKRRNGAKREEKEAKGWAARS